MADAIQVKISLLPVDINATGQVITRGIQSALDAGVTAARDAGKKIASALNAGLGEAFQKAAQARQQFDKALGGGTDALKKQEAGILSLAQATARLQKAQGDSAGAANTLKSAIDSVTAGTAGAIRAQTQLVTIQNQVAAAAEKAAAAQTKAAQAAVAQAGQKLSSVGTALTVGVTAPIVGIGIKAVQDAASLDSIKLALVAVSGSAAEAEKQLARIRQIAKLPGIGFEEAVQGSVRLQAVGFSAFEAERALKAFANAVAITGGGKAQLAEITVQLGQLAAKGKVLAQDLRPIIEAAPAVGKALKAAFGTVSSDQISQQLEAAGKSSKDFIQILLTELEKLPQVTGGFRNDLDNFADNTKIAFASIGNAVFRVLSPALEALGGFLSKAAEKFSSLSPATQTFIVLIAGIVAAIGPLLVILATSVTLFTNVAAAWAFITAAFAAGGAGIAALSFLITPLGLALAGLAAVLGIAAVAWFNYESAADSAKKVSVESITAAQGQIDSLRQTQAGLASLTATELASVEGHERLKAAITSLDPGTQTYINSLKDEQTKFNEVNRVIADQIKLKQELLNQNLADVGAAAASNTAALADLERRKQGLKELAELTAKLQHDGGFGVKFDQSAFEKLGSFGQQLGQQVLQGADATKVLGDAMTVTAGQIDATKNAQAAFGAEVSKYLQLNQLTIEGFEVQQRSLHVSESAIQGNVAAFHVFEAQQAAAATAAAKAAGEIVGEAKATDSLSAALGRLSLSGAGKVISDTLAGIAVRAKNIADARRLVAQERALNDDFNAAEQFSKRVTPIQSALTKDFDFSSKAGGGRGGGGGKSVEESLFARLTKQAAEAQLAIDQLRDTLSPEFKLRIAIEDKQAFKGELENIIKLRRELSLPLDSPLPKDEAGAKAEIANLKAVIENLHAFKVLGEFTRTIDPLQAFREGASQKLITQTENFSALQSEIASRSDGVRKATLEESIAKQLLTDKYRGLEQAQKDLLLGQAREIDANEALKKAEADRVKDLNRDFRSAEVELRSKELAIQNAINAGVITEAQGRTATLAIQRESAAAQISILQNLAAAELDPEKLQQFKAQIEGLRNLGAELAPAQAFLKGLRSDAETTADAFLRIGTNFKDKFLGVLDSGIDRLTKKFGFFKDLIGDILKSLTRQIVSSLFGGGNQGGGGSSGGGGGGGGGILGFLSNLLGGNRQGSSSQGSTLANVGSGFSGGGSTLASFLTPGFAGGNPANAIIGGSVNTGGTAGALASLFFGGGSGVSAPPSVTQGVLGSVTGQSGQGGIKGLLSSIFGGGRGGAGGGSSQGFLGKILGGLTGGGAVSLLPALLGAGLGSALGGQSGLGQILGALGGGAVGLGVAFGASVFGAGGSLGAASLAALGPIALIGIPLLVGAFLLGRAKQRRTDEASSGDALQEAVDKIHEFRDQIRGDQAQSSVENAHKVLESTIIAPFIAVINTLKTKSVRDSRLRNQVPDLRNLFEKEVIPEIAAQQLRLKNGAFGRNLIPEFATGGVVGGIDLGRDSVMALLRPREMVLTIQQQQSIARMAGHNVFAMAGVPGAGLHQQPTVNPIQPFAGGGTVSPFIISGSSGGDAPIEITIVINNGMSEDEAVAVVEKSVRGSRGRGTIIKAVKKERSFGA